MTEMILKTLPVGPLEVNCYILGDSSGGPLAIVDAGGDDDRILAAVRRLDRPVRYIVNTHCHFDHVIAVDPLMKELKADYLIHSGEKPVLKGIPLQLEMFGFPPFPLPKPARYLADGEQLALGGITLTVIHTPGHSPGGICLYCAETGQVLTGDTLFMESVGRTDLPGGDTEALLTSIREKLMVLPKDVRVYPGHGPSSTIGHEIRSNPFL